MWTVGSTITFSQLFDIMYDTVIRRILNPDYREPHANCLHYADIKSIGEDIFCPKCGILTKIITYPYTIPQTSYKFTELYHKYFSNNDWLEGSFSKYELICYMIKNIYGSLYHSPYSNCGRARLTVNDDDDIELTTSFIYLQENYKDCERCYKGIDKYLESIGDDIELETISLVCFEIYDIGIDDFEAHIESMKFFKNILGLDVEKIKLSVFDHRCQG